jgi:4-hydroxybenzoate polyprenyltransferase
MPATPTATIDAPTFDLHFSVISDLFRPVTLVPVLIIAVLFGFLGAGHIVTGPNFWHLLLAGGLLVVANGLSNVANGLGDWVEDSVHPTKQDRPTVSGVIDPTVLMSVVVIGWGAAVFVSVLFLPIAFTLIYIVILGFAWAYSYPPRLKARFPLNMLAISTPRGALGIAAAWVVLGSFWAPELWGVLAVTVPFVLFGNEARNISDMESDRVAGVRTIATIWGESESRDITALGFIAPSIVVTTAYPDYLIHDPWLVMTIPLAIIGAYGALHWDGVKVWKLFYLGFALISVLFFLPLVVG